MHFWCLNSTVSQSAKNGNDDLSILPPPHVSYRNGREWRRKKRDHLPEQILIWNSHTVSSPLTSWPGTHSQHKAPRYLLTQGPSSSLTYFPQCPPHRAAQSRMRSSQKQLVSKRYIVPRLHPLATSRILPIPPFQDPHRILVPTTCRPEPRWESHIDRLRQNEFRHRCAPSRGRVELTNNRCNTPLNQFAYCVVLCNQASDMTVRSWRDRTASSESPFVAAASPLLELRLKSLRGGSKAVGLVDRVLCCRLRRRCSCLLGD